MNNVNRHAELFSDIVRKYPRTNPRDYAQILARITDEGTTKAMLKPSLKLTDNQLQGRLDHLCEFRYLRQTGKTKGGRPVPFIRVNDMFYWKFDDELLELLITLSNKLLKLARSKRLKKKLEEALEKYNIFQIANAYYELREKDKLKKTDDIVLASKAFIYKLTVKGEMTKDKVERI